MLGNKEIVIGRLDMIANGFLLGYCAREVSSSGQQRVSKNIEGKFLFEQETVV